jgi:hypothetical protein
MSYNDVSKVDYWESWFTTYNNLLEKLKAKQSSPYWERWFEIYSSKLKFLKVESQTVIRN